jgi:hypothetical protein
MFVFCPTLVNEEREGVFISVGVLKLSNGLNILEGSFIYNNLDLALGTFASFAL